MKEFFKKNWKIILICLLALTTVSKCTQSCNRGIQIDKLNVELNKLDSVMSKKDSTIDMLSVSNKNMQDIIDIERKHSENFTDIAIGNQNTVKEKMDRLDKENRNLKYTIKRLTLQNDSLKTIINNF